jgi:hypothetical protein
MLSSQLGDVSGRGQPRLKLPRLRTGNANQMKPVLASILSAVFFATFLCSCSVRNSPQSSSQNSPSNRIDVVINRNIELFGLLMQLDNGGDILTNTDVVELDGKRALWRDWYQLTVRNYERYKSFADGSMMKLYRDYLARGFYNDFLIGFLLQVDEVPRAQLRPDTDSDVILAFAKSGNSSEARAAASAFLDALNRFYREAQFESFLRENNANYDQIKTDVTRNLPPASFVPIMERFYQKQFNRYCLVPSLNIPTGMGFGKTHKNASAVFNVFGPFTFQSPDSNPPELGFNRRENVLHLSAHEFGHSFVNPAIDKLPPELIQSTEHLFAPIKDTLTKQSYPSWTIALYEHFVRAGEVLISRELGDYEQANRILRVNATNGFVYLAPIVVEFEGYAGHSDHHPSYDDFVLRVLENLKTN